MWLTDLKIAIVEKDIDKLSKLIDEIPQLETEQEMQEALYLAKEVSSLAQDLKDETSISMKQIKKNLNFLKSTEAKATSTLNIRS